MKKNNYQESHFISGQDRKSKSAVRKKRMPIIKCVCGAQILVVPDLNAMNIAIKKHVAEHKQTPICSDNFDSLEQFLTEKVLLAASKANLPNSVS